jgi:hypothetical protein
MRHRQHGAIIHAVVPNDSNGDQQDGQSCIRLTSQDLCPETAQLIEVRLPDL